MIILGVDTAIRVTGYGVVNMTSASTGRVLDCGVIKNSPKLLHSECLRRIAGGIRQLIDLYHPEALSMEDAFVKDNMKTAMILSLARGAVITAAAENTVPVYAYAPTKVKKAVFGNGSARKEQMALILASMFQLNVTDVPLDATDALGMALCHAQLVFFGAQTNSLLIKQI